MPFMEPLVAFPGRGLVHTELWNPDGHVEARVSGLDHVLEAFNILPRAIPTEIK